MSAKSKIYQAQFSDGEVYEICSNRSPTVAWRWLGAGKKINSKVDGDYGLSRDVISAQRTMERNYKKPRHKGLEIFSTEIVAVKAIG